ncbi:MAG: ATP-binding protein, partial [Pseudomonadota bacterium]
RTADLNDANRQLLAEVQERRMAETRLRETQTELIQAGKLAALGQMSAALSHEFNQPLAAVKSYSENAAAFLDRNKLPQARENMGRISDMADRMAEISRHLRNFARRPQEQVGAIPLNAALDDALALMESRLGRENATLIDDIPDGEVQVIGGRVRLQQVIVNLLSNALDAMADQAEKRIDLSVEEDAQEVRVVVRDRGPGLGPDVLEKAFDPFFTTKGPGKGLGLGLSISFNIIRDFGGRLEAANHPEGGAVFTIVLRPAPAA